MSWLKDAGNIFVAPSSTFNTIKNADWKRSIAPFIILILLGVIIVNDRLANPKLWQVILGWSAGILSYPVRVFMMTLFVMIIGNTVLGGNVNYGKLMVMTAYVYVISILEMIVKIPLMLSKWSIEIYTGLGLLGFGESGSFINGFMAGFDLFGLWRIILLAIGMGILYENETKPFLWALLIYWVIQISVFAGLGMIF